METTRKSTFDLEAIAWGAFFILWGITKLLPSLPEGAGALGIGAILLGLNLARYWKGQPTSSFTTTLGILAILLGALELARPLLHLSFDLPIFAMLLLALGLITLIRAMKQSRNQGNSAMETTMPGGFAKSKRSILGGTRAFGAVWFGQVISFIGSGLTSFALGVWVLQKTGEITKYALISMFFVLPGVLLGPLAGTLVDRWDRRKAMLISDLGAGLSTLSIAILYLLGGLQVWYIYVAVFMSGAFSSLRMPSMQAAMTQMIPRKNLGRASGMMEIVTIGEYLIAPAIAGGLMGKIGLAGVIMIDFLSFLFALSILFFVRIPRAEATTEGKAGSGSLLQESAYGWKYITGRPGLAALMLMFALTNFTTEMTVVLFTPLILSFGSTAQLGMAMSLSASGFLAGGLLMSIWGGPKRRIQVVIICMFLLGLFLGLIGLRPSVGLIILNGFLATLCVPIISSSNQVIWQRKVAADVQGRVFAIRRTITLATPLLTYVVAGPLSDRIFEPMMAANGPLAGSIGQILGTGAGRGIGLLFVTMGLLLVLITAGCCLLPHLRRVEDELPDAATHLPAHSIAEKQSWLPLPA